MEHMSHEDQHRRYPAGTTVIAANGERLGVIRNVYPHFFLVSQENHPDVDLEVPTHAIVSYDGQRLYLSVNRHALTIVDAEV